MPKIKSKRGAMKRFKVTAGGKVRHAKAFKNHILTNKGRKRKRHLKALGIMNTTDGRKAKKLLST